MTYIRSTVHETNPVFPQKHRIVGIGVLCLPKLLLGVQQRFFFFLDRTPDRFIRFYILDTDSTPGSQVLQGWSGLSLRSTTVCTDTPPCLCSFQERTRSSEFGPNHKELPLLDWDRNQPRVRGWGGGGMLWNCCRTEVRGSYIYIRLLVQIGWIPKVLLLIFEK